MRALRAHRPRAVQLPTRVVDLTNWDTSTPAEAAAAAVACNGSWRQLGAQRLVPAHVLTRPRARTASVTDQSMLSPRALHGMLPSRVALRDAHHRIRAPGSIGCRHRHRQPREPGPRCTTEFVSTTRRGRRPIASLPPVHSKFQFCRNPHGILTMPYPAFCCSPPVSAPTATRSLVSRCALAQPNVAALTALTSLPSSL